jgi:adenylate kinase
MEHDRFHVVYLTGAPATGKSSLTEFIAARVAPLRVLTYSKLLAEYISAQSGRSLEENELRKRSARIITPEDVAAVDQLMIDTVTRERTHSHVIIDSHPVTKETYGFRVTPFSIPLLHQVRPTLITVLYAEPDVVIERIKQNSQGRPMITPFESHFHNDLQASVALIYSINLGIPAYLIDTNKPRDEVAEEIINRLRALNPDATIRIEHEG